MTEEEVGDTVKAALSDANLADGVKNCTFPFRYKKVLYYACTDLKVDGSGPFHVCATETDFDFNAKTMGVCDTKNRCPIQCKL